MTLLTCPVCNGTCKVPLTEEEKQYSWNRDKTDRECTNCGGQTMYGRATGKVPPRRDNGEPCKHEYGGSNPNNWRCYVSYCCKHCGFSYEIDSSD